MSRLPELKTLLALIDFSPATGRVEALAAVLAMQGASRVYLLHIVAPEPDFVGYRAGPQSVRDQLADAWRTEHARLQEMAERLRHRGLEAVALQVQGPVIETVLDQATRLGADLVIAGFHRHGALRRLAVGDTLGRIMEGLGCPVVVVPERLDEGREA